MKLDGLSVILGIGLGVTAVLVYDWMFWQNAGLLYVGRSPEGY